MPVIDPVPFDASPLVITGGACLFASAADGTVRRAGCDGLWWRGRRLLAGWTLRVNAASPALLGACRSPDGSCRIALTIAVPATGDRPAETLGLLITRHVEDGGLREEIVLHNHASRPVRVILELGPEGGDAQATPCWSGETARLRLRTAPHTLVIGPAYGAPDPMWRDGMLAYLARIPAQECWHTALRYDVTPPAAPATVPAGLPRLETPHPGLDAMFRRALARLPDVLDDPAVAIAAAAIVPDAVLAMLEGSDRPALRLVLLARLRRLGMAAAPGALAQADAWLAALDGTDEEAFGALGPGRRIAGGGLALGQRHAAWTGMAALFGEAGWPGRAALLQAKAHGLARRAEAAVPDGAEAGLLLWSGLVTRSRVPAIARRLFEADLWSGWGVRTRSADDGDYDPLRHGQGGVSPAENGLIAMGLARYGMDAAAARIAAGLLDAADRSDLGLPSLIAGLSRETMPVPIRAPGTAWRSGDGAVFGLLQSMLGLQVAPPLVSLRPALPDWLPRLTLGGLAVGTETVDVDLWREGAATRARLRHARLTGLRLRPAEPP